jgi:hypothetical protein
LIGDFVKGAGWWSKPLGCSKMLTGRERSTSSAHCRAISTSQVDWWPNCTEQAIWESMPHLESCT